MELDPALLAVAGALSTVAGLLYRSEQQRAKRAEDAEIFWRDKALANIGLAQMATEEAEKRETRVKR